MENQRSVQAAKEVCMDLLLDAVSEKEGLKIHPDEAHQFIEELADQYGIAPEEAEAILIRKPELEIKKR